MTNFLFAFVSYFCHWGDVAGRARGGPQEPLKPRAMAYYEDDYDNYYDYQTYNDYNGTYVQDVEGWSDQLINDALDGEPDAYWNID